jgi:acetyltransferase-like isoleucine patch superfamily enzyme
MRNLAGMDIGRDTKISLRANLDTTNPRGVHIGDGTLISFHAVVFAHDLSRHIHTHTYIGSNCFIGAHAIVMPGVTIGDQSIVGAGSVVTRDVPSGSIVGGNPARVLRSGIRTIKYGILLEAYEEELARASAVPASDS